MDIEQSIHIQVSLQQEIKACDLLSISFEELLISLRGCFREFDEKFIQYIDDEGDLILFSSTEELELALKISPNVLRVVLQKEREIVPWTPKEKRARKRTHSLDRDLAKNVEALEIDDERQRNKKFRAIGNTAIIEIPINEPWPAQFERLFVDGNNLMFLTNGIRSLTLRKKFRETERAITSVVESFAECVKIDAVVMFDGTPTEKTKDFQNGSKVQVTSARPAFPTTDEAFIFWAKSNQNIVRNTLTVTSDRALAGQLSIAGMSITKPSSWFKFVVTVLTKDPNTDYRQWIDSRIGNK